MTKRNSIHILLTILLLLTAPAMGLFSQDQTEQQWWLDKPIMEIRYSGINHVSETELRVITDPYIGKAFTNKLFSGLQTELFALQYFSYFSAKADRGGVAGEQVIITFTFVELPIVGSLTIEGVKEGKRDDLIEKLKLIENSFVTSAKIKSNESAILDYYHQKGFISAEVVSSYTTDTVNNTIALTFVITEGVQSRISEIRFEGNDHISANTLRKTMKSKEQSLFNQGNYISSTIDEDKVLIRQLYGTRGYVDAQVSEVRLEEEPQDDPTKRMLAITFVIDEGDVWTFGGIEVQGNSIFTADRIQNVITHKTGAIIDLPKVQQNISAIANLYWNDGYIYNTIDTKEIREPDQGTISFKITIEEKQQAVIEDVVVRGNERTKDKVLYREIETLKGEVFSISDLTTSLQNLYNTGIIEHVDYEILYGSQDGYVVLDYTVRESNRVDLEFGVTFGGTEEFPVSGFFSWKDKNFLGNGQDFSIGVNISPKSQSLDFSFNEGWLFDQRWNGGVSLSIGHFVYSNILQDIEGMIFSEDDFNNGVAAPDPYNSYAEYEEALEQGLSIPSEYLMSYDKYNISLGLNSGYTFHTPVGRLAVGGSVSLSLSKVLYDDTLYRPLNPVIRNNLDVWQFSNKVGVNFSWDGRDLIENTTTGFLFQEGLTYAGGLLGGISNYIKNSTTLAGFLTLFELPSDERPIKGVLSAKTNVSALFDQYYYDSDTTSWELGIDASQAERLYIDGMNIARGSEPIYNLEFLWDNSIEFSMPISERVLWAEAYTSATGYLTDLNDLSTLGISDFYFSSGIGVRLVIPGFPLGLYLTKNYYVDGSGVFHWEPGTIFKDPNNDESGFKLVLAITTSLY